MVCKIFIFKTTKYCRHKNLVYSCLKVQQKKLSSELWFGPSEPLTTRFIYKKDFGFFQSQKKKESLVKLPAFVVIDLQWWLLLIIINFNNPYQLTALHINGCFHCLALFACVVVIVVVVTNCLLALPLQCIVQWTESISFAALIVFDVIFCISVLLWLPKLFAVDATIIVVQHLPFTDTFSDFAYKEIIAQTHILS